jgi:hypothetical protein
VIGRKTVSKQLIQFAGVSLAKNFGDASRREGTIRCDSEWIPEQCGDQKIKGFFHHHIFPEERIK